MVVWLLIPFGFGTLFSVFLLFLLLKKKMQEAEESIVSNPPTFIEVLENKPMSIKIDDKWIFKVRHPSSVTSIRYFTRLRQLYSALKKLNEMEDSPANEKAIQTIYLTIALVLCNMSKKEYKGVFKQTRYEGALIKKCIEDTGWMTDVVSQINDFWKLIKKKERLQAEGLTIRQVYGETFTWGLWQKVSQYSN